MTEVDNAAYAQVYNTITGYYDEPVWEQNWCIFGNHPVVEVLPPGRLVESHPELDQNWYIYNQTGSTWHVLQATGWTDDLSWAGGGYFHIKSSYPSSVGPWIPGSDGYGEISYASMLDSMTMMSNDLGQMSSTNPRRFFGFDGPAGAMTHNADNSVTVTGTFDANSTDIPDGSGINIGNMIYFNAAAAVPEPASASLLVAAVMLSRVLHRKTR